jgi:hypothetical protein
MVRTLSFDPTTRFTPATLAAGPEGAATAQAMLQAVALEMANEMVEAAAPRSIDPEALAGLRRNLAFAGRQIAFNLQRDLRASGVGTPHAHRRGNYDPAHVLDDSAFTNVNSMSSGDIQRFLESHHSDLAGYRGHDGRSAAQIIHAAAERNGVNPQVLLATLQKEQGLVNGSHAHNIPRDRLDWALGYGVPDHHPRDQRFRGFENQIDHAAHRMRQLFDRDRAHVPTTMMIDGQPQRIDNAATMMLYQYTPHASGQRLFHDVWHGFFGDDGLGRPRR